MSLTTFILTKCSIDVSVVFMYLYAFSQLAFILGHWGLMYVICKQWRQIVDMYIIHYCRDEDAF